MNHGAKTSFEIGPSGILTGVRWIPSLHCDDRPPGTTIDLLVIHSISLPRGTYGTPHIDSLFCGVLDPAMHPSFEALRGLKVSAHVLIARDGTITQYVPFSKRAWHAGESCYKGKTACNDYSIGIELEGTDDSLFEAVQYQMLKSILRAVTRTFPKITPDRIVGHSDIAPGRKTDPGTGFNWAWITNA